MSQFQLLALGFFGLPAIGVGSEDTITGTEAIGKDPDPATHGRIQHGDTSTPAGDFAVGIGEDKFF